MTVDPENSAALIADFFRATPKAESLYRVAKGVPSQRSLFSSVAESIYVVATGLDPESLRSGATGYFIQGSPLMLVRLGDLYLSERRYPEAARAYGSAVHRDSGFALGFSGLGTLYVTRFDGIAVKSASPSDSSLLDSAISQFRKATKLAPEEPIFVRNLGIALARRHELAAADSALRAAVRLDTLDGANYAALGWLQQERGDLNSAEQTLRHGLALGNDPSLNATLGEVFESKKKWREAEEAYRRGNAMPRAAAAAVHLGADYLRQHRVREAEAAFRRALVADSTSEQARAGLERVRQMRKR